MKIITVLGARPQFIKAAAVSKKLREKHEEILVHTGQHYDENMSKIFFEELDIPSPGYSLNIGSGNHGYQTGMMLIKIEEILMKEKPDCVLIYGDTNSTAAGALSASKLLIPVAHVEAGLRSLNMKMPEEQNRIVSDHLSKYLLAPTETAVKNLNNEGIRSGVYNVGDVMYDAILHFTDIAKSKSRIIDKLGYGDGEFILSTIHRAENTNDIDRLKNIVDALNESNKRIILPLHPRTKKFMEDYGLKFSSNIDIIEPVGYLDMILLEANSCKILTDSGGVQKEAFFLSKPCITMRDDTEWVETIENGWNVLVGADKDRILDALNNFVPDKPRKDFFGDGKAADRIISIISSNKQ